MKRADCPGSLPGERRIEQPQIEEPYKRQIGKDMYICYRKKMLRLAQIWFYDKIEEFPGKESGDARDARRADIAFYHNIAEPQEGRFTICQTFHSQISDLTLPEEELFAKISKTERYQIRKNSREDVAVRIWNSEEILKDGQVIEDLAKMYEAMYASKGHPKTMNREQVRAYTQAGGLYITCVEKDGEPLVYHSYTVDRDNARLLHSVSDFREREDANLIAHSNKRLHWEDMKLFAGIGIKNYDWGGISSLTEPNGIDIFKMKFGGTLTTYYNVITGQTLLGRLAMLVLKKKGL